MDGIANVAKQQTQAVMQTEQHGKTQSEGVQKTLKSANEAIEAENKKLLKEQDVDKLVKNLNEEIALLNTSLKFGVDKDDIFYVSVIDKKTNKMIRRWPAEHAQHILPKMKELTGLLFDTKG